MARKNPRPIQIELIEVSCYHVQTKCWPPLVSFKHDGPVTTCAGSVPFVVGDFQRPVAIGGLSIKGTQVSLRIITAGKRGRASGYGCPSFVVQLALDDIPFVSIIAGATRSAITQSDVMILNVQDITVDYTKGSGKSMCCTHRSATNNSIVFR